MKQEVQVGSGVTFLNKLIKEGLSGDIAFTKLFA